MNFKSLATLTIKVALIIAVINRVPAVKDIVYNTTTTV